MGAYITKNIVNKEVSDILQSDTKRSTSDDVLDMYIKPMILDILKEK